MVKKLKQLPVNSLPLRYTLLPSLSNSTSNSPCSCITTIFPFRNHSSLLIHSDEMKTEDLRLGSTKAGVEIVRILDPEHREPFVSLSRIFLACSISTLEGLLTFNLRRPDYDSSLAGIAPFKDIWVNLITARKIATNLNILDELAGFLEFESRLAWSVEDKEVGGLIHNWKISNQEILPDDYSTNSMLATPFSRLHILPKGTQVRTLLPEVSTTSKSSSKLDDISSMSSSNTLFASSWESLHSKVVEWTLHEFETYLSLQEDFSTLELSPPDTPLSSFTPLYETHRNLDSEGELALTISTIFTTSLAILSLSNSLPHGSLPSTDPLGSTLLIGSTSPLLQTNSVLSSTLNDTKSTTFLPQLTKEENFLRLQKSELLRLVSSETISMPKEEKIKTVSKGILGVCEFMDRLVIREWRREEELRIVEERSKRKGLKSDEILSKEHSELVGLDLKNRGVLEERIRKLEERDSKEKTSILPSSIGTLQLKEQNQHLQEDIEHLINRMDALESSTSDLLDTNSSFRRRNGNADFDDERGWISARELNFVLGVLLIGLIWMQVRDYGE